MRHRKFSELTKDWPEERKEKVAKRVKKTIKKVKAKKKSAAGSWHYQVVHQKLHNGEDWFAIHEAHLNDDGENLCNYRRPNGGAGGNLGRRETGTEAHAGRSARVWRL